MDLFLHLWPSRRVITHSRTQNNGLSQAIFQLMSVYGHINSNFVGQVTVCFHWLLTNEIYMYTHLHYMYTHLHQVQVQVCNEPIQCTTIGVKVLIKWSQSMRIVNLCARFKQQYTLCLCPSPSLYLQCECTCYQTLLSLMLSLQQQYQSKQQCSQQLQVTHAQFLVHLCAYVF